MGKKDWGADLDKEDRKRLEKLQSQWADAASKFCLEKLTLPDLRLLLEHFAPLQELIRELAATPTDRLAATPAQLPADPPAGLGSSEGQRHASSPDSSRLQAEHATLQAQCRTLQQDLAQCTATSTKLLHDARASENARQLLEKQLRQAQADLDACRKESARACKPPTELGWLRSDAALAQQLGLGDLPADDTRALIQIVAVLAQPDNLERLWEALKARCDEQDRPASEAELALLQAALAWCNHNWRSRPYRWVDAKPGAAYDFDQHLRGRHTTSGETIAAQRLPGLADGQGKLLRKPLVATR